MRINELLRWQWEGYAPWNTSRSTPLVSGVVTIA
jgi:hypothetical protein